MKLTSSLSYSGHLFWPDQQDFLLWSWMCSGFFSCLVVFLKHKIGMCLLMYKYHSPQHYDLIWFQAVAGMCVCVLGERNSRRHQCGSASAAQHWYFWVDDEILLQPFRNQSWQMSHHTCIHAQTCSCSLLASVKKSRKYPHLCFCLYMNVWEELYLSDKKISKTKFKPLICIWKCCENWLINSEIL